MEMYGRILKQAQLGISNAFARNYLYIDLNPFSGMGHLLIRLRFIGILFLYLYEPLTFQHPIEGFDGSGIASFTKFAPELNHSKSWVSSPHVVNELEFFLCMLIRVMVWSSGFRPERLNSSIPAFQPEVDVRTCAIVFSAGFADSMRYRILHEGLLIVHILCYSCHAR